MDLSNLRFSRIAVHYIPRKSASDTDQDPEYGDELIDLGQGARDILTRRVTEVLGNPSFSVEMDVLEYGEESTFQESAPLIRADERNFIDGSCNIADHLNNAQQSSNIPSSVLLVAGGHVGTDQNNAVALIKAETQDGFSLYTSEGDIRVEFIDDLFLTPDQKLYKVGLFVEIEEESLGDPLRSTEDFEVLVYDSNLRQRGDAAKYFYRTFLGCDYAKSGKQLTKSFFQQHQKYFDTLDVDSDERKDLKTHLYSYLKLDQDYISTTDFADNYISAERRPSYMQFMTEHDLPEGAIEKDLSLVESSLKNRQIRFGNGVVLRAQADNFDEKVQVEDEEPDATVVRVLAEIEEQS